MSFSNYTKPVALAAALGVLAGCRGSAPDDLIVGERTTDMLVFVKATAEETLNRTRATSNLYTLSPISPDGTVRPLTAYANASIYDPCVSFDGKKILFSMAPEPGVPRNIWEINADGTGLRKVSGLDAQGRNGDDFDPLYLPDGRIAFTSNRPGHLDEYNRSLAEVLHVMNTDGSGIEQISFNMSDDFDPFLLPSGRIAYTRWDHHGTENRFPMFATNPDGTGTFHLFGSHGQNFFHTELVPDGRLVTVLSNEVEGDAGPVALCRVEGTRDDPPQAGLVVQLTPEVEMGPPFMAGAYKYPRWIGENRFVVSYSLPYGEEDAEGNMNEDDADFGLYTFEVISDGQGGETIGPRVFLYNDPNMQEYDAQLVAPHDRPEIVVPVVDHNQTTGVFHVSSIFNRQTGDGQERPQGGDVSQVMVIESIFTMPGDNQNISATEFERKRILGTAPVEADGSFHIRVPANTPLSFNLLDAMGRSMVTKRNWIYARPGEKFLQCAGCHDDRGRPASLETLALARPASDVNPPLEQRRIINFRDTLAGVVQAKCTACHVPEFTEIVKDSSTVIDTTAAPGAFDLRFDIVQGEMMGAFPIAYLSLAGEVPGPDEETGAPSPVLTTSDVTVAGFSRRSVLIDRIFGVGTAQGRLPHPDPGSPYALTDDEKRNFMTWVDLGAQYR